MDLSSQEILSTINVEGKLNVGVPQIKWLLFLNISHNSHFALIEWIEYGNRHITSKLNYLNHWGNTKWGLLESVTNCN